MRWIDTDGDSNRDGFVDYIAARATGLVNQGWKDSGDSVFHADGRLAEGPIALVEVQGYVYAARLAMAWLAERRGENESAERLRQQAQILRVAVEEAFWVPELGFYAIALDGHGEPCRVRASNAGQLLYTRLPSPERDGAVLRRAPIRFTGADAAIIVDILEYVWDAIAIRIVGGRGAVGLRIAVIADVGTVCIEPQNRNLIAGVGAHQVEGAVGVEVGQQHGPRRLPHGHIGARQQGGAVGA